MILLCFFLLDLFYELLGLIDQIFVAEHLLVLVLYDEIKEFLNRLALLLHILLVDQYFPALLLVLMHHIKSLPLLVQVIHLVVDIAHLLLEIHQNGLGLVLMARNDVDCLSLDIVGGEFVRGSEVYLILGDPFRQQGGFRID